MLSTAGASARESEGGDGAAEQPDLAQRLSLDGRSPYLLVANADVALAGHDLPRAESLYLRAVEVLPEYTAAHYGLVVLYRRQRRPDQAVRWLLEAIRSPLAFRGASFWAETYLPLEHVNREDYRRKCLLWLQQARPEQAGEWAGDPLFQIRHRLTFAYGVTNNDDYLLYDEAIEAYLQQGRGADAVRLAVVYGELMMSETTPFRERYGFTLTGYRQRLLRLFRAADLERRLPFLEA
jgi:tetratricopeptide (TPR) repeat protein